MLKGREARKKIFIKVSGDEYLNPKFLRWIKKVTKKAWVVICVGGGTQINKEFKRLGFKVKKHGPMGRETKIFKERQIQRDVLEANQEKLQNWLLKNNIFATVEIPVLTIGTVLCPVNGDQMVRTVYLGFDKLYVVTSPDRVADKELMFSGLRQKVKIKSFS